MTLWQLPQWLLGRIVLLIIRKRIEYQTRLSDMPGVTVYRYTPKEVRLWGVSFGPIIILANSPVHGEQTLRHEYGHSRQSRMLGPMYLIVVGIPSFIRAARWLVNDRPNSEYYEGYPESWADRLGGVTKR